jgi:protein-glucosylgalactosylhydroxylysine glucosidase
MEAIDQIYDFSCGELTTRFKYCVGQVCALVEVLTFCDRVEPTLVCQEMSFVFDSACDVELSAIVDAGKIGGRALRSLRETPGESKPACDGALLWESAAGFATCGLAYFTHLHGAGESDPDRPPFSALRLSSAYTFRAYKGRRFWSKDDMRALKSMARKEPLAKIAQALKRTPGATRQRATQAGISLSQSGKKRKKAA